MPRLLGTHERAAQLFRARRLRDDIFDADVDGFGEPAWDMLLGLMAAEQPATVDDVLGWLPKVPAANADTYLRWLASRDLVAIGEHVELTGRAITTITAYLEAEQTSAYWVNERRADWGDGAAR